MRTVFAFEIIVNTELTSYGGPLSKGYSLCGVPSAFTATSMVFPLLVLIEPS
jgi:hypothetical protein